MSAVSLEKVQMSFVPGHEPVDFELPQSKAAAPSATCYQQADQPFLEKPSSGGLGKLLAQAPKAETLESGWALGELGLFNRFLIVGAFVIFVSILKRAGNGISYRLLDIADALEKQNKIQEEIKRAIDQLPEYRSAQELIKTLKEQNEILEKIEDAHKK